MSYQNPNLIAQLRGYSSLTAVLIVLSLPLAVFAQSEKVIYEGAGLGLPNMVTDSAGNLYGADYENGPVFELTPPGLRHRIRAFAACPAGRSLDRNYSLRVSSRNKA